MYKHKTFISLLVALISILFLSVRSAFAAPKDGPVVTLATEQSEFPASQDVLISVTFSNPTNRSVRILKWFVPTGGLEEPVFTAKVDGEAVSYTGAIYKRPAANGNDYVSLKSGESITHIVNLGDYYDLTKTGQYEIFFDAASVYLYSESGNKSGNSDALISESISLKIEGRLPTGKPTPPPPPPSGGTAFSGCTTSQQSILVNARKEATTYASSSKSYLAGINSGTSRYGEWFGIFTTSRYNTVSNHFTSLTSAWSSASVNFDCRCKQNYYAYVYPSKPYYIYLCKVFWMAPLKGTDSQAGTLIHEMSHFNVVASTQDYVYGQSGARNLAISNPDNAIMNADNHEYFAENNPTLP